MGKQRKLLPPISNRVEFHEFQSCHEIMYDIPHIFENSNSIIREVNLI